MYVACGKVWPQTSQTVLQLFPAFYLAYLQYVAYE